jgi:hypothetical protein
MKLFKKPPQDTSVEAQYADGFVLSEHEHNDISPYNDTHNILRAILNKDPEQQHGKMVRFSVFYQNKRLDIDWTDLPDNARPIRFRNYSADFAESGKMANKQLNWLRFGYQATVSGKNIKEIIEL